MNIEELLAQIGEASDEELTEGREAVESRMEEHREAIEAGTVDGEQAAEIEALGDAHRQISAEQDTRAAAAEERSENARQVLSQVTGGPAGDEDEESEEGGEENPESGEPIDPEQPATDPQVQPDAPAEERSEEREPVMASARNRPALGQVGRSQPARERPRAQRDRPRIFAAADTGYAAGQPLNADELARAFSNRLRAVSRAKGSGDLVHVATIESKGPKERRLVTGQDNTARIEEFTSRGAITAAGGLCAPFTPDYSIDVVGSIARPVRDALAGFQADRGGIWFRPNLDGAATAPGASGVWTNDDDAAVDGATPPDPKPYAVVECPEMVQAEVEAETFQLEFSNVTTKFDPESTAANIRAALVAHARWAENRLLTKLQEASTHVTYDQRLGATRDVLAMLDQVIAYYRSIHRLDSTVALRMILPAWVLNMLRVDVLRAMHTANENYFSITEQRINQWFADRGVNITWHMDGNDQAGTAPAVEAQRYGLRLGAGDAIPEFPGQVDALLFLEGEWLHLDGGELDLGVVRDSSLIGRNRYRTFTEEWVGVAFKGIESLRIVADLVPNGASAGTVDPIAAVDGGV